MFTLIEVVELVITVFALGYIFSGFIQKPMHPIKMLLKNRFFDWEDVKYSALVVAPAVILHELGHKFIGLALGYEAIFHASYVGLAIGAFLRIIGSPFLFFIPGWVSIPGAATASFDFAVIALAGPAVNLILYFISWGLLVSNKYPKFNTAFYLSKQINLLLFAFNMIPFSIFDGAKILSGAPYLYIGTVAIAAIGIYATFKIKLKPKKILPIYRL